MRILHISTRLILGGSQENTVLSCEGQARRGHEVHLAFGPIYGPEGSLLERVKKFSVEGTEERRHAGTQGGRSDGATERRSDEGGEQDSEQANKRASERGKIQTHVIPNLVREINPIKDRRALRELRELIERIQPDIVHTHSSKAGILGRWAAWRSKPLPEGGVGGGFNSPTNIMDRATAASIHKSKTNPPQTPPSGRGFKPGIIHTIHGPPFMPIEGGPIRRLKIRALNYAYTLAERSAARHCHRIVSVADAMTREFLRRGIGTPEQYVTVRSGMEIEPFLTPALHPDGTQESRENVRAMLGLKPDGFVIGTVARLAQHKGHDDLLDALASDLLAHPNWKLLWVGDGWWRDRLVTRATSLNIAHSSAHPPISQHTSRAHDESSNRGAASNPQLLLTGLVPPEQIPALLRAMDVLAHPSYREGLPRTVPQALLTGVPVVAYDCDGTGEVCRDMDTGLLVKTGDIAALGNAIRWMAEHPDERRAMAERGRARCVREFSAENMVDDLERVYAEALQLARD